MSTQEAISKAIEDFLNFYQAGGYVMPALVISTILLWYAIGYRVSATRRSARQQSVREMLDAYLAGQWSKPKGIVDEAIVKGVALMREEKAYLRRYLDDAFSDYYGVLKQHVILIRTLVSIAPLLGLLGTVVGMIETFDSLKEMALFTQDGGIAGGISQALVTTQFGLAVAIPGLLVSGYLDKRQRRVEMDLAQIKDILCSMPKSEVAAS